jgi:hypothetical protein
MTLKLREIHYFFLAALALVQLGLVIFYQPKRTIWLTYKPVNIYSKYNSSVLPAVADSVNKYGYVLEFKEGQYTIFMNFEP